MFFEEVFLPELKKQKENNTFVQALTPIVIVDPITGIRYTAYSLPINMMPSSENERIVFNSYKNDFTKLSGQMLKIGN